MGKVARSAPSGWRWRFTGGWSGLIAQAGWLVTAPLPEAAGAQTYTAQGEVIYEDDTHVRILALMAENRQAKEATERKFKRRGMYTTALVIKHGERVICLYRLLRAG